MKYLIILLFGLSSIQLSSCEKANGDYTFNAQSVNKAELQDTIVSQLGDVDANLFGHWKLVKVRIDGAEDYSNEDGGGYAQLILNSNGTYIRPYQNGQYQAGNWKVKDGYLGFFLTEVNGDKWEKSTKYSFAWKLISIKANELILRVSGGHGYSFYLYEPKNINQ